MKISREGVLLIKSFEGFRPRAVLRADGRWVVGYGHTASARQDTRISEAEAELLLQYDLIPVRAALIEGLSRSVNQHQFDALASFAFSVGTEAFRSSEVLAQVNAGAVSDAAASMAAWPERAVRDAGLHRRAAERALFVASPGVAVTLADLLCAPLPEANTAVSPRPQVTVANDQLPAPSPEPAATVVDAAGSDLADSRTAEIRPVSDEGPDRAQPHDTQAQGETPLVPGNEPTSARPLDEADTQDGTGSVLPETVVQAPATGDNADPDTVSTEADSATPPAAGADAAETPQLAGTSPVDDSQAPTIHEAEEETPAADPDLTGGPAASPPAQAAPLASFAGSTAPGTPGERSSPYTGTGTGSLPTDLSDKAQAEFAEANPALMADPFTGAVSGTADSRSSPIVWPAQTDEQAATGHLQVSRAVAEGSALSTPRLVWPGEETRTGAALIEDDAVAVGPGTDDAGEQTPATRAWTDPGEAVPTRFSWRRVWGFLLMGSFGLVSLAMAMAALRKASLATSDVQSILAIAAVLATIGIVCVGVSAFNIYQRLSDDR